MHVTVTSLILASSWFSERIETLFYLLVPTYIPTASSFQSLNCLSFSDIQFTLISIPIQYLFSYLHSPTFTFLFKPREMQGLRLLVLFALCSWFGLARTAPQVPCYFIFGDSLVDNGNNNNIASLARANYPPYGIDFPDGPTGRFSNGLTTIDVICKFKISSFF